MIKSMRLFDVPLKSFLRSQDVYVISMAGIYALLSIVYFPVLNGALSLLALNILIMGAALGIGRLAMSDSGLVIRFFHSFYVMPIVPTMFFQIFKFIPLFHSHDYDDVLIAWDKAIFGVNPTEFLHQYSHPLLTEFLQLSYVLFFFHAIALGMEFFVSGDTKKLNMVLRITVLGFFISYLMYFFMPAIGPRFTLHNWSLQNIEQPGIFFTKYFRDFVDSGDGIPLGTLTPELFVHRNCMPSGHTMMTLSNMVLAFQFRSRYKWLFFIMGSSLIVSTVYLRYHYVVDVAVGIICSLALLWFEPKLNRWMQKKNIVVQM